jgi:hypothetical protein
VCVADNEYLAIRTNIEVFWFDARMKKKKTKEQKTNE